MFKTILVPLDGSSRSRAVLRPVAYLAKGLGSAVTLLYVLEPTVEVTDEHIEAEAAKQRESARPLAEAYLAETATILRRRRIAVETVVLSGRPHDAIVSYAAERRFDLVAMATHARKGIARAVVGSVAGRVLQATPCPLLLVRPRRQRGLWASPQRLSRLVVPLDGSNLAEAALPYAEHAALKLGLPITLIQVIPLSVEVTLGPSTAYVWNAGREFADRLDVLTTGYLAGIARRMTEKGIAVEWDTLRGRAAEAIVDWARGDAATLIVMATHGRSGFGKWMVGGVADAVVRGTEAPVLVVPPPRS